MHNYFVLCGAVILVFYCCTLLCYINYSVLSCGLLYCIALQCFALSRAIVSFSSHSVVLYSVRTLTQVDSLLDINKIFNLYRHEGKCSYSMIQTGKSSFVHFLYWLHREILWYWMQCSVYAKLPYNYNNLNSILVSIHTFQALYWFHSFKVKPNVFGCSIDAHTSFVLHVGVFEKELSVSFHTTFLATFAAVEPFKLRNINFA